MNPLITIPIILTLMAIAYWLYIQKWILLEEIEARDWTERY